MEHQVQELLINELNQGKDLVTQLCFHLDPNSSKGKLLIENISTSLFKAILMLKGDGTSPQIESYIGIKRAISTDSDSKHFKKRKTIHRWSQRVRASAGSTLEGSHEDGYSWRKYGQKNIQGAKYQRGYYRCTHSSYQGCKAKKQVQRSNDDPLNINISYQGRHTCTQAPFVDIGLQVFNDKHEQEEKQNPNEIILNFQPGLQVKTSDLNPQYQYPTPLTFPSTTSSSFESTNTESQIFSPLTPVNSITNITPQFTSSSTSELNYCSPCHKDSFNGETGLDFPYGLDEFDYASEFNYTSGFDCSLVFSDLFVNPNI